MVYRPAVIAGTCTAALAGALIWVGTPAAGAQTCPPGHLTNSYSGQCFVAGSAPTINGIPCVASNLGTCRAMTSSQQPPRKPRARFGA